MSTEIMPLAERLIALRTDPDNRPELQRALNLVMEYVEGFTIERFEKNGSESILVYTAESRPSSFTVLLNGHLDVIPGKDFQYQPVVKGDRLYGVGSMDMKSNVACLIAAFKQVARQVSYPIGLQLVTDEEIGGFDGTLHQIEEGVRADFVIAGESTNFDIVNQAKGVLWLKVMCKGETAHGAYPWRGRNAVVEMTDALNKLLKVFPTPKEQQWVTTINVSRIETSNATFNKVPDDCTALLDIRFVPKDAKDIVTRIKQVFPQAFSFEVIAEEPALDVPKENPFVELLKKSTEKTIGKKITLYGAQGSSDARHFTRIGVPGVEFGPIGRGIGTDSEWVSISSLATYQQVLTDFLFAVDELG